MAANEDKQAVRQATLDALEERIVRSVEELVSGDDWRRAIEFAARFRTRSFNNTLLIWAQHLEAYEQGRVPTPTPTWVAGYNDWRKMGRWPEKDGGYRIRGPVKARFASATPRDPASWRRLGKWEEPRPSEVVRRRIVSVVPAYVWDVSRTHGDPLPERPRPRLLEGEVPAGLWEGLTGQAESLGFEVLRMPRDRIERDANGCTDFETRQVMVCADMDPAAQVKTLAHELAHVRLDGPNQQEDAREHRGISEVRAESVALMIAAAHGMDTSDYTIPYVAGWAANVDGKDPVAVVRATGEQVRSTAFDILDKLDTPQLGNGNPLSLRVGGPERTSQSQETPEQTARRVEPLPDRETPAAPVGFPTEPRLGRGRERRQEHSMSDTPHEDAAVSEVPDPDLDDTDDGFEDPLIAEPPHPINWNLLNADDAEVEWLELNRWVDWLRHTYGLPASVIPPAWYTHPELLWELSALHLHWLCAYDPEQNGSAPLGWHRDFADARQRLREWVAASGTKLDHDRPTRQTVWPGEEPADPIEDVPIIDRDAEFVEFVMADVAARREAEEAFYRDLDPDTGEVS